MRINRVVPELPMMHNFINESVVVDSKDAISADTSRRHQRGMSSSSDAAVCFKIMGRSNSYNSLVANAFKRSQFVFLARDGAGICDSYYRRGLPAEEAAHLYNQTMRRMRDQYRQHRDSVWIRFEDFGASLSETIDTVFAALSIRKPSDGRYLYKVKLYGPGNEMDAQNPHTKKLLSVKELQNSLRIKQRSDYLTNIPEDYWRNFARLTENTVTEIGYEPY